WQSGYAADCNSVYAGSIPTPASTFRLPRSRLPTFTPFPAIVLLNCVGVAVTLCATQVASDPSDPITRLGGEIARRKGLKIPRPQGRAGPRPAPGTNMNNKTTSCCMKPG